MTLSFKMTSFKIKQSDNNLILMTDSYKLSHYKQYPEGTEYIMSYFESRGGKFDEVVFYGLQYYIKKYLLGVVVTKEKIDEAKSYYDLHFGNNKIFYNEGWEYILNVHGGCLPVEIRALPEGTVITTKNVLFTIKNTDPKCFWLTNFLETLLVQVWYPITVATNSREQKKLIYKYLEETGDPSSIGFKLHDFGYRGVSSHETAGLGSSAHLINFLGTDTIAGLVVAREYYNENCAGFSIPASEHSTMTSWGDQKDDEISAFRNMLEIYPDGLVSVVSDGFDIYNACENIWGGILKNDVLKRNGILVIRPDSGDPVEVNLKILEILDKKFGSTVNSKGYKVLDPHVRIIQGDGINYESLEKIMKALKDAKWSIDNIAFGSGGGLLQKHDRDTQKCAFKCCLAIINGEEKYVYKNPVTDSGKISKKGHVTVHYENGKWETRCDGNHNYETDYLKTVFLNGRLTSEINFDEIRSNSEI